MKEKLLNRRWLYWFAIIGYGLFLTSIFLVPLLYDRIEAIEWERFQDDPMCLQNGGNSS